MASAANRAAQNGDEPWLECINQSIANTRQLAERNTRLFGTDVETVDEKVAVIIKDFFSQPEPSDQFIKDTATRIDSFYRNSQLTVSATVRSFSSPAFVF